MSNFTNFIAAASDMKLNSVIIFEKLFDITFVLQKFIYFEISLENGSNQN